jgi:hypothetical protein
MERREIFGEYSVDRLGRVYSGSRELKTWSLPSGYRQVNLGRGVRRYVHRLVLEAFVGPCPEGEECRHLNGDPGDNRLANLCWGTVAENRMDKVRHGTGKLSEDDVRSIRARRAGGALVREIAEEFGISPSHASMVCRGKRLGWVAEEVSDG